MDVRRKQSHRQIENVSHCVNEQGEEKPDHRALDHPRQQVHDHAHNAGRQRKGKNPGVGEDVAHVARDVI